MSCACCWLFIAHFEWRWYECGDDVSLMARSWFHCWNCRWFDREMAPTTLAVDGDKQSQTLHILHFNDVYNVESCDQEPVGGAARFCTALKSFSHLEPLVLFSGDIFAPSFSKLFFFFWILELFLNFDKFWLKKLFEFFWILTLKTKILTFFYNFWTFFLFYFFWILTNFDLKKLLVNEWIPGGINLMTSSA